MLKTIWLLSGGVCFHFYSVLGPSFSILLSVGWYKVVSDLVFCCCHRAHDVSAVPPSPCFNKHSINSTAVFLSSFTLWVSLICFLCGIQGHQDVHLAQFLVGKGPCSGALMAKHHSFPLPPSELQLTGLFYFIICQKRFIGFK